MDTQLIALGSALPQSLVKQTFIRNLGSGLIHVKTALSQMQDSHSLKKLIEIANGDSGSGSIEHERQHQSGHHLLWLREEGTPKSQVPGGTREQDGIIGCRWQRTSEQQRIILLLL